MSSIPETAKQALIDTDTASLEKRVLASIAQEPGTRHELTQRFPNSENAVGPRINDLLRRGCVKRLGKRENPSGHEAYVHHITQTGKKWLAGEIDKPTKDPTLSELERDVITAARDYCNDKVDVAILKMLVERHDRMKARIDPEA